MKKLFATVLLFASAVAVAQGPPPSGNAPPGPAGTIVYQAMWTKNNNLWIDWPPPSFVGRWEVQYYNGTQWTCTATQVGKALVPNVFPSLVQADVKAKTMSPRASIRVFGWID